MKIKKHASLWQISFRRYFEEKIARVETNAQREIDDMVTQSKVATDEVKVSMPYF